MFLLNRIVALFLNYELRENTRAKRRAVPSRRSQKTEATNQKVKATSDEDDEAAMLDDSWDEIKMQSAKEK
ncbi:MAG: hypothetical protein DMG75_12325 [Acidobacteria bacterium]|nr:MAG: hypothetical protein DMG75_12325 [Acidobacteriota bacterium]